MHSEVDGDQWPRGGLHGGDAGVVLVSKFAEGAWIMVLLVPTLLSMFYRVHRHYQSVGPGGRHRAPLDAAGLQPPVALLPIRGWSAITRKAMRFAIEDLARGLRPAHRRRRAERCSLSRTAGRRLVARAVAGRPACPRRS